jgi:hypothetical protein
MDLVGGSGSLAHAPLEPADRQLGGRRSSACQHFRITIKTSKAKHHQNIYSLLAAGIRVVPPLYAYAPHPGS